MNLKRSLDSNIVEKFTYLPSLMGMEVISNDSITIINSDISCDMFNIACMTKNKDALKFVVDKFKTRDFAWWIGFEDDYQNCKNDIEKLGLICDETETAMVININSISRTKKCEGLNISLVDSTQKLIDFTCIYKNYSAHTEEFYSKAEKHILTPQSSLKLFVGYYDDKPVATSALFAHLGVAGIWDVTTLPEFRRKGIGTDMTIFPLSYAFENFGYKIGVLTASKDGEQLYQKIGFKKLKDFYVFNVRGKL